MKQNSFIIFSLSPLRKTIFVVFGKGTRFRPWKYLLGTERYTTARIPLYKYRVEAKMFLHLVS